ncbi:unnamed protein product [Toxocara canis]|uniref:Secreted protein n=2 Tax=Toxocara canis TaxID=6265 RepID=A0A183TW36_TOXCA|nr:unnamed protein product [Toxocara canis]
MVWGDVWYVVTGVRITKFLAANCCSFSRARCKIEQASESNIMLQTDLALSDYLRTVPQPLISVLYANPSQESPKCVDQCFARDHMQPRTRAVKTLRGTSTSPFTSISNKSPRWLVLFATVIRIASLRSDLIEDIVNYESRGSAASYNVLERCAQ